MKLRYVAGSTAATLTAWSSMLACAQLNWSTWVTPDRCRTFRTIAGVRDFRLSTRMSAVCSGASNGPGRSTAWSSVVGLVDGSTVGPPVWSVATDVGGVLSVTAVLEDPSSHPESTRAGSSHAATAAAPRLTRAAPMRKG